MFSLSLTCILSLIFIGHQHGFVAAVAPELPVQALQEALARPARCSLGPEGIKQPSLSKASIAPSRYLKVALLFLTKGPLPYEPLWRTFLAGVSHILVGACDSTAWQELFTLYVHPPPGHGFESGSLFAGRALPEADRVKVEWGSHTGITALKRLLSAALADVANQRFVLLSESCVPLYPGWLVAAQLLREKRSRVDACANEADPEDAQRRMTFRMVPAMQSDSFKTEHWRKSSQFLALIRQHAQLVVDETELNEVFKSAHMCLLRWMASTACIACPLVRAYKLLLYRRECYPNSPERYCLSDEHYVSSMLAAQGRDAETDCMGAVTNVWWEGNFFHPKTWGPSDVSAALLPQLRLQSAEDCHSWRCNADNLPGGRCNVSASLTAIDPILLEGGAVVELDEAAGSEGSSEEGEGSGQQSAETSNKAHLSRRRQHRLLQAADAVPSEDGDAAKADDDGALGPAQLDRTSDRIVQLLMHRYPPLDPACPLFARKFSPEAVSEVQTMAAEFLPWKL